VERLTEPHDATRESKGPIANVLFIIEHAALASMHDAMTDAEKNWGNQKSEIRSCETCVRIPNS
jgi:hypothetical protein